MTLPGRAAPWLAAALAFNLLFSWRAMAPVFRPDVLQDDTRQHVFWTFRLHDARLFPNDLIADYYAAVAPPGYTAIYWTASLLADPNQVSRVLPLVLGLATSLFTFLCTRRLHPAPIMAFLAAVLVSWQAWQQDDLSSATPRAFCLPLLAGLCWAQASERRGTSVAMVVGLALLYPPGALIGLGLLGTQVLTWANRRPRLSRQRSAWFALASAALLSAAVYLPTQLATARFGPVVSAEVARGMPDFGPGGRQYYFVDGPWQNWIDSNRGGFYLRVKDPHLGGVPILVEELVLAALLPLGLVVGQRSAIVRQLSSRVWLLPRLIVVSLLLWGLAHLLLFRLYFPARYVAWSLPLALCVLGGLGLGLVIERIVARSGRWAGPLAASCALGLAAVLAAYPAGYKVGLIGDRSPRVTAYLRQQPIDTLIAGVPRDVDGVPSLTQRSVLVSRQHALPFHLGYYAEIRQRLEDLIAGYYAESLDEVVEWTARYGIDVLLVNRGAFRADQYVGVWGRPYDAMVAERLQRSRQFALLERAPGCAQLDDGQIIVVLTACLDDRR